MADNSSIIIQPAALAAYERGSTPFGIPAGATIALDGTRLDKLPGPATGSNDNPVNISLYGQLRNAFETFNENLQKNLAGYTASVSNLAIADAELSGTVSASALASIDVTQLAQSQQLLSLTVPVSSEPLGSGKLRIDFGRYDSSNNRFDSTSAATTINLPANRATLQNVADAINQAGIPVQATISSNATGSQLLLESTRSGSDNSLRILVDDSGDNTDGDNSGLSQLAYDPTATAGSGKNMTEIRPARDAEYTLDGEPRSSSSNSITDIIEGLTVTLKQTGSFNVQTGTPFAGILRTTEDIVNAYNQFVDSLPERKQPETSPESGREPSPVEQLNEKARSLQDWMAQQGEETEKFGLFMQDEKKGRLGLNRDSLFASWSNDPQSSQNWLDGFRQRLQQQSLLEPPATGGISIFPDATQSSRTVASYYQLNSGLG